MALHRASEKLAVASALHFKGVDLPLVLFLCTENSARSQMAEALLTKHGGGRFESRSAGLEPTAIHPLTVEVMTEIGIDVGSYRSKSVSEFLGKIAARYVIVVCRQTEQHCPKVWPFGGTVLFWPFDDPAADSGTPQERLAKFREVRDQIEAQLIEWLAQQP